MSGMFSGLQISASALKVNQSAMSIVSNNIANVNTKGYHKQRVNLATLVVGGSIGGSVTNQVNSSMGVELISVDRYNSLLEGDYYNEELSKQGYLNKQKEASQNILNQFDEVKGNGLETALNNMYAKLDNLSQYPTDSSAKISFVDSASVLADKLNSLSNAITKQKTASVGDGKTQYSLENSELGQTVDLINQKLEELTSINKMIMNSNTGTLENNNLLDRKDALLQDLAQYANFEQKTFANGSINLKLGGTTLIAGSHLNGTLDVKYSDSGNPTVCFTDKSDNSTLDINKKLGSGIIGGLLDTSNYDNALAELDSLAETFSTTINNIQTQEGAYYIDGQKLSNQDINKYKIFTTNDNSNKITAQNITINPLLTQNDGYNKVATAYFESPDKFDENSVGNVNNINNMLNTKNTLGQKYSTTLGKISSRANAQNNASDFQDSVVKSVGNRIQEQTGVDMNEELTDLVKYQTAFEASAKVFSVCNKVLDTLMSLGD